MRRVEAACARAGVEVTPPKATPPRTIRRDSESDSESDSEPDDDDRSPPVATAATPSTDIDDISRAGTPQSGPRVPDVVPQPRPRAPPSALLTRAVEAAADAVAAAEAAADASFDDAEERLSPQRDADRPVRSISAAPSRAASPAPPRPAGLVRARDDAPPPSSDTSTRWSTDRTSRERHPRELARGRRRRTFPGDISAFARPSRRFARRTAADGRRRRRRL